MKKYNLSLFLTVLANIIIVFNFNNSVYSDQSLLGEWKVQSQIATLDDGKQESAPDPLGELGFYENGIYVVRVGNEEMGSKYSATKSNHVEFSDIEKRKLTYVNFPFAPKSQFATFSDKLTFINEAPFEGFKRIKTTFIKISKGENNIYQSPNLEGYHFAKEWDVNTVWIKDTHVMKYTNSSSDRADKFITNNHVWGWSVVSNNVKENFADLLKNYKIRDSNCNGTFDEKYSIEDEWPGSPACARWTSLP